MRWSEVLPEEDMQLGRLLAQKAQQERLSGKEIYPPQEQIFRALELTAPDTVRVVIVGQDPYHGAGQANGLAFSVGTGVPIPPSLKNIFKVLQRDAGVSAPVSGDLTSWAQQGVLLLNTVLTVEAGKANSHVSWGWQKFVFSVFRWCATAANPIVFLLWGRQARSFIRELMPLDGETKGLYCSSHPSPLGAGKGSADIPAFLESTPFSSANRFLTDHGMEPIDWALPGGGT